jgi:hypothetical protein
MLLLFANYLAGVIAVKNDPYGEAAESVARSNRYLQQGGLLGVLGLLLVSNRLAPGDMLMQGTDSLLGLCYAMFGGMFAVGIIFLSRLWRELMPQFRGVGAVPLLKAIPASIVLLTIGLGTFVELGKILERFPRMEKYIHVFSFAFWGVIAFVFMRLWSNSGKAALLTRTYLLVLFTAIIAAAGAFYFVWISSLPDWPVAYVANAAGLLNILLYLQIENAKKQAALPG